MTRSQTELDQVANRSYWHNNGFFKLLLIDKRPKYSIRLHIWPEHPFQEGDVHNHPWDMSGLVLNGSYEWPIYTLERALEKNARFGLYECQYLEDYSGHLFRKKGNVILNKMNKISMQQGGVFQLPPEKYHSVKKENSDPADSIVITGDSKILNADVVSSRAILCNAVLNNAPVESSFLRERLALFMGRNKSW